MDDLDEEPESEYHLEEESKSENSDEIYVEGWKVAGVGRRNIAGLGGTPIKNANDIYSFQGHSSHLYW